jgi:probable selenium-dependent hydroxylase accessory protein YqeC
MGEIEKSSLAEQLGLSAGSMLCIVGAGGKTSLLYHLSRELRAAGVKVLATSTTHLSSRPLPEGFRRILFESPETCAAEVDQAYRAGLIPALMRGREGERFKGLPPDDITDLVRRGIANVVLVEADGARTASFKIPRDHEPVIPRGTTHMTIVVGLDALEQPIDGKTCFHPEMFAPLATPGDILMPELARELLYADGGYLRYAGEGLRISIVINKADDDDGKRRGAEAARWFYHPAVSEIFITSLMETGRSIRAANGSGPVWGVLLAAGEAKRGGGDKLLWGTADGVPLILRSLDNALKSRLDGLVLVLGHRSEDIMETIPDGNSRLQVVVNPDYPSGIASSIRTGLAAVPEGAFGAAILLGDQPGVGPALIDAVLDSFRGSVAAICRPTSDEVKGHPVIFRCDMYRELMALEGDLGGRSIVSAHPDMTFEMPWDSAGDFMDIDTPEDLERLKGGQIA